REVHRSALRPAQPGCPAHEFGEALLRRRAASHGVVVAAVGGEDVVVGPQRRAGPHRHRLLTGSEMRRAFDEAGHEEIVGGAFGTADELHLLVQREDVVRVELRSGTNRGLGHGRAPFAALDAAVLRCDCASRKVFSAPPAVQYLRPATSRSSAGNLVMTSQPSDVTTTSSSIRAADQPSAAGQYVSRAKTIPSSRVSGCSRETSRLKIGFSQMDSPTPWPYCSANAAVSSAKPNSSARGQTVTMSAVVAPGFTSAIARSMYSRHRV